MTIWAYLAADLWKRLLLTASILVTVIAFAAAIQPLADGKVGPADALRFMGLAVVPMLQYALPFAAGFAATLAFHDFAADNEAMACSAGGVSYRSLLAPAAITGLILALVVYALTTAVIPRFIERIEQLVARDIARILTSAIQRGESVTLRDLTIHADQITNLGPDPDSPATDRLVLQGVVAVATDENDNIEVDVAARRADVWPYQTQREDRPATQIVMRLTDAHGRQAGAGAVDLSQHELGPWAVPSGSRDRIKTRTAAQLDRIQENPDRRPTINRDRRELAALLTARLLAAELAENAARDKRLTLDAPDGRVDIVTAGLRRDGRRWAAIPLRQTEPVELVWRTEDGAIRRQLAESAHISIDVDPQSARADTTLELTRARFADTLGEATRERITRAGLAPRTAVPPRFFEQSSEELLAVADALRDTADGDPAAEPIVSQARRLRSEIEETQRVIIGHEQERYALSAATLIMTILGAVMALKLRDSLPLTVYLWSFFPALFALITISSGSNATENNLVLGVAVIWVGVTALGALTLREFVLLRRH